MRALYQSREWRTSPRDWECGSMISFWRCFEILRCSILFLDPHYIELSFQPFKIGPLAFLSPGESSWYIFPLSCTSARIGLSTTCATPALQAQSRSSLNFFFFSVRLVFLPPYIPCFLHNSTGYRVCGPKVHWGCGYWNIGQSGVADLCLDLGLDLSKLLTHHFLLHWRYRTEFFFNPWIDFF